MAPAVAGWQRHTRQLRLAQASLPPRQRAAGSGGSAALPGPTSSAPQGSSVSTTNHQEASEMRCKRLSSSLKLQD